MDYKVFINHTQKDSDLAKDLARRLEEAGVKVFPVEKSAVNGESVITTVNPWLQDADEMIVIVTSSSVNSPGLNSQTGAALGRRQRRLTRIVVNVEGDELPPFPGKTVRYADLQAYIPIVARRRPLTAQQRLIQAMQLVFDKNANSEWNYDMEDSLWGLTQKLPDKETVKRVIDQAWYNLTLEDVEELRELSDKAGGWAHARDGKPVFVDRSTWKDIHTPKNRLPRYSLRANAKNRAIRA
jgi:hypothetical protein